MHSSRTHYLNRQINFEEIDDSDGSVDIKCGLKGINAGPRYFSKLKGSSGEVYSIYFYKRTNISYSMTICNSENEGLYDRDFYAGIGDMNNTRIVDLNKDSLPDLISYSNGYLIFYENQSTNEKFQFASNSQTIALDGSASQTNEFWVEDFNGDGNLDIVAKRNYGFRIFYGLGNLKYSKTDSISTLNFNNAAVDVSTFNLSFIDFNGDGLSDLLATNKYGSRLFFQKDSKLVEAERLGVSFYQGVNQGIPRLGSFSRKGGRQLAISNGRGNIIGLSFKSPGTGLLAGFDDGKGSKVKFTYDYSYPEAGIGSIQRIISSIERETIGRSSITDQFIYSMPASSKENGSFLGFSKIIRKSQKSSTETTFEVTENQGALVKREEIQDPTLQIKKIKKIYFTNRSYQGIDSLFVNTESTKLTDGNSSTIVETKAFTYTNICQTQTTANTLHGMLTTSTEIEYLPILEKHFHCLPKILTLEGVHPDSSFNFKYQLKWNRDDLGDQKDIWMNNRLIQTTEFDHLGRINNLFEPGFGTQAFQYFGNTNKLRKITDPNGVTTEVNAYDAVTDRLKEIQISRNQENYIKYFEFDSYDRLRSGWNSISGGTKDSPRFLYDYSYPTTLDLGYILTTQQIESGVQSKNLNYVDGAGESRAELVHQNNWYLNNATLLENEDTTLKSYRHDKIIDDPFLNKISNLNDGVFLSNANSYGLEGLKHSSSSVVHGQKTNSLLFDYFMTTKGLKINSVENGTYLTQILKDGSGRDISYKTPGNRLFLFSYDVLGRIRKVTLPSGNTQEVTYDNWGMVSQVKRNNIGSILNTYDNEGLLKERSFINNSGETSHKRTIDQRDSSYRVVSETLSSNNEDVSFVYSYDGSNLNPREAVGQLGFLTGVSGDSFSKQFVYRMDGKILKQTLEFNSGIKLELNFTYNMGDGISSKEITAWKNNSIVNSINKEYKYNSLGKISEITVNGRDRLLYSYLENGQLDRVLNESTGILTQFERDSVTGKIHGIIVDGFNLNYKYYWTLDNRGNVSNEYFSINGISRDHNFSYDEESFLKLARSQINETFSYDEDGLRESSNSRDLDSFGRLSKHSNNTLVYGAHGNIIGIEEKLNLSYVYDEAGQLLTKIDGDQVRFIKFDSYHIDADLNILEDVKADGISIAFIKNDQPTSALFDLRSTFIAGSQEVHNASAYGVQATKSVFAETWGFAGSFRDADLQLDLIGSRHYDAYSGLFATPDFYFLENTDECIPRPIECSLYGYARNNPLKYFDPLGNKALKGSQYDTWSGFTDGYQNIPSALIDGYGELFTRNFSGGIEALPELFSDIGSPFVLMSEGLKERYNADTHFEAGKADQKVILGLVGILTLGKAVKNLRLISRSGAKNILELSKANELIPTHKITMGRNKFRKFVEQIRTEGIKESIKFVEHEGKKYVVDGHHRLRAARQLKIENVPTEKVDLPYKGYKTLDDLNNW